MRRAKAARVGAEGMNILFSQTVDFDILAFQFWWYFLHFNHHPSPRALGRWRSCKRKLGARQFVWKNQKQGASSSPIASLNLRARCEGHRLIIFGSLSECIYLESESGSFASILCLQVFFF